jgi:hypothetical protein
MPDEDLASCFTSCCALLGPATEQANPNKAACAIENLFMISAPDLNQHICMPVFLKSAPDRASLTRKKPHRRRARSPNSAVRGCEIGALLMARRK